MAATIANSLTLISSGLADTKLLAPKGNPNIEQFVKVLRKTTRFAASWERIEFDGFPEFGRRVSCTLPRKGELISGLNIVVTMPDIYTTQQNAKRLAGDAFLGPTYGWTNSLGHALIQLIELEIGGEIVERLNSQQLEILDELYETVEATVSKNAMIKRAPNGFSPQTWLKNTPCTVYVPIPFWFSRPGVYSHALPIQALTSDIVRIHVTFRPLAQLFYTDARVNVNTVGYRPGIDTDGGMWGIEGGRFWQSNPTATGNVFSMNANMVQYDRQGKPVPLKGEIIPVTFPLRMPMVDAYALVEYVSLEENEAMVLRSSELTYHVEQHFVVPVEQTQNTKEQTIAIPYTNPTKEIMWVFQRPEAELYNAWFLFSRDVGAVPAPNTYLNPCLVPWWPDASILPSEKTRWLIQPAFQRAYSEPMESAILMYNSYDRFQHEGAFLRSVVPATSYVKSALYNRYVYAYSFGQKVEPREYTPKGVANWDKIPKKELCLIMKKGRGGTPPPNMNVYIYVTIWNVFKVYGGRGGMLFST